MTEINPHVTFLEGWKFFLALGTLVSIPIGVSVWMLEKHEQTTHPNAVTRIEFQSRMDTLESMIRESRP